jgi:hypothetical protein
MPSFFQRFPKPIITLASFAKLLAVPQRLAVPDNSVRSSQSNPGRARGDRLGVLQDISKVSGGTSWAAGRARQVRLAYRKYRCQDTAWRLTVGQGVIYRA